LTTANHNSLFADFLQLTKFKLSLSVVFSSLIGYLLGAETVVFKTLALLFLGGYFMVGASNAYNQIIERNLDKKMERTKNRPMPTGRLSKEKAFIIATIFAILGIAILYTINEKSALFGAISIFLYVSAYTPLKTITPLSIFVGAIPGAIPFMLGWVAATNHFGIEAGVLFLIQFVWQFPHFWALAWFLDEDYARAGFKLLPTGKKDAGSLRQIILYSVSLILVSIIPAFKLTGNLKLTLFGAIIIALLGVGVLYFALKLNKDKSNKTAKQLMLASVSYLTLMQLMLIIDKFLLQ
jgi:protoheme IX farnesyltransferase